MLAGRTLRRGFGAIMNVPAVAASPEDFPALLEDGAFIYVLREVLDIVSHVLSRRWIYV